MNVWWAVVCGAVGGVLIGLITEYYTGGEPVKKIAESGETGPATVMISGLSVGMQSVVIPILILATIILDLNNFSRCLWRRNCSSWNAFNSWYYHGN